MKFIKNTTLQAIVHALPQYGSNCLLALLLCKPWDVQALGCQVQLCLAVVFYRESKTDESKSGRSHDLKSVICFNKALEQLGEAQVMLKVLLQALLAIGAQHKPHLQRSEAPA